MDIVYFNQDLVSTYIEVITNVVVDENISAQRFIDSENPTYVLIPSSMSTFNQLFASRISISSLISSVDNSFVVMPESTSIINNLIVRGVLSYKGTGDIDNRYVLENQPSSISTNMIRNNIIRLNELDTTTVDQRYVNRAGDTMTGNLILNDRNINSVNELSASTIRFNGGVVLGDSDDLVSLPTPPNCGLDEFLTWDGDWSCISSLGLAADFDGSFGGLFTVNLDGICRYPNPQTSSCSCPEGFEVNTIDDFANPTCAMGLFDDGFRTIGCGTQTFYCAKSQAPSVCSVSNQVIEYSCTSNPSFFCGQVVSNSQCCSGFSRFECNDGISNALGPWANSCPFSDVGRFSSHYGVLPTTLTHRCI